MILTCQKIKLVLIVWETASLAHVSRLSFIKHYNKIKNGLPGFANKTLVCKWNEWSENFTICELNSFADCKLTKSHLSWAEAAPFACRKQKDYYSTPDNHGDKTWAWVTPGNIFLGHCKWPLLYKIDIIDLPNISERTLAWRRPNSKDNNLKVFKPIKPLKIYHIYHEARQSTLPYQMGHVTLDGKEDDTKKQDYYLEMV